MQLKSLEDTKNFSKNISEIVDAGDVIFLYGEIGVGKTTFVRFMINYLESKQGEKIDGLVVLPATAPLRKLDDVNSCIDKFEDGNVDTVITVCEANRNPYFNMVANDSKGYSSLVIHSDKKMSRRQEAPKVFDMTTVAYVVDGNFVKEFDGIFDGKVKSVTIAPERAIDIDTIFDFKIAEYLILNR